MISFFFQHTQIWLAPARRALYDPRRGPGVRLDAFPLLAWRSLSSAPQAQRGWFGVVKWKSIGVGSQLACLGSRSLGRAMAGRS